MDKETVYIGIDLTDPYAKHIRPVTRAILDENLRCVFDEWHYEESGTGIIPFDLLSKRCIIAIDGSQGLAGSQSQKMRHCEHQLGTAGKSPFELILDKRPFAGFIKGSVRLFYSLFKSGDYNLYGMESLPKNTSVLIEVYPGAAWRVLVGGQTKNKKKSLDGRKERFVLIKSRGITFGNGFSTENPPTHDQLDAALAAYIAYLFGKGMTVDFGESPFEDNACSVLREGFIVQPR
jgi:hypothetical protein